MATREQFRAMANRRKANTITPVPETQETSLLDSAIDVVSKTLTFAPSLLDDTASDFVGGQFREALKEPRRVEAIEEAVFRGITLRNPLTEEIKQEIIDPKETSLMDFISTQGRLKESAEEVILPDVSLPTEEESKLNPIRSALQEQIVFQREIYAETIDMMGYALRPDQIFGILPLFNAGLKLVGNNTKKLIGIIRKSGIKKSEPFNEAVRKIYSQTVKETGIKPEKLNDYMGNYYDYFSNVNQKAIKYKSPASNEVAAMFERSRALSKAKRKFSPKSVKESLKRNIVDVSGNIKKKLLREGNLGKEAVMNHDLIAGASAKSTYESEAVKRAVKGRLTFNEALQLDEMIVVRNEIAINRFRGAKKIAIQKELKKKGITTAQKKALTNELKKAEDITRMEGLSASKLTKYIDDMPVPLKAKLNERANLHFKKMREVLKEYHSEGLIDDKLYNSLLEKGDYSPRNVLKHIDPHKSGLDSAGKKISISSSGLKSLDKGSLGLIETDSSLLMNQVIARKNARILKNRANQSLFDMAKNSPENGVVFLQKPKNSNVKFENIDVMINGKKKSMFMAIDDANEWVVRDPMVNRAWAETVGYLSGSKILKPMATGLNPGFALTNYPRDIAHAWLTTQEFSPVLPKAAYQIGRNSVKVFKDALFRKGRYLDMLNEGGGMPFLTHQGRISRRFTGTVGKLQTYLGYVGETSEITGRLLLREQAILNGKTAREATWIARNYLDFSQGGSFIKGVDTAVPYLNAGIQGTRGVFRAAATDPALFTSKVAQVGTLAAGLYMANRHVNKEAWRQISDRDKVNNWIITTPFSFKNSDGEENHIFFKIAKDQGQRVFATAFENLMAKFMKDEDIDWTQVGQSIKDGIPASITTLPPTISAALGYLSNKDFWLLEDIWKGHEVINPYAEYFPDTPGAFVKIGDTLGMSPERTRFAVAQVFTRGNIYTSLVGHGYKYLFDDMPDSFREQTTTELILKQPIIKRMVNFTRPFTEFRDDFKDIDRNLATEEFEQNREFNRISKGVRQGKLDNNILNTFVNQQPIKDRIKLKTRHFQNRALDRIPDNKFWIEMLRTKDPVARARKYDLRLDKATDEKRKELQSSLLKIPGVRSVDFIKELNRLKQENKK